MNVIDSSAWIEYLGDGPSAGEFAHVIENCDELVVPVMTLYEVFKRVCQIADEARALNAVATMLRGRVVELSASLSMDAARMSLDTGLGMADSIILATARAENAVLWTQDADFAGMPGIEYRAKR